MSESPEPTISTEPAGQSELTPDPQADGDNRAVKDAVKYRHRAQEAEARLAELSAQRDALARQNIEIHLGQDITPTLFWKLRGDQSMDGLLDDTGAVDPQAVTQACEQLIGDYGLTRRPRLPKPDPSTGLTSHDTVEGSTWSEVVRGR